VPTLRKRGLPDPELRAALAFAELTGVAAAGHLLLVPPLASMPGEQIVAPVGPSVQRYLTGPIGTGAERGQGSGGRSATLDPAASSAAMAFRPAAARTRPGCCRPDP